MTERRAIHELRNELFRARVLLDHAASERDLPNRFRSGFESINALLDRTEHLKATAEELKQCESETFSKHSK